MTKDQIRAIALANGFTIKDGQDDLKDYVYELAKALLATRWQPIETAPRDGRDLLLYSPHGWGVMAAIWLTKDGGWYTGLEGDVNMTNFKPTHWMPMPEPPQDA